MKSDLNSFRSIRFAKCLLVPDRKPISKLLSEQHRNRLDLAVIDGKGAIIRSRAKS